MSTVINKQITLETTTCWKCGITHAVPKHFLETRREDKEAFYCPNGHSGVFKKSTSEILREQLEAAQRDANAAKMREQSEREQKLAAGIERDKAKRANTRIKKRIAAGVCPCCKSKIFSGIFTPNIPILKTNRGGSDERNS